MNKKRALSILVAAAMAAGTLATSVPVYADDVEEITWMFWDDLEATEAVSYTHLRAYAP